MAIFLLLLMIYGVVCVLFAINFIVRFPFFIYSSSMWDLFLFLIPSLFLFLSPYLFLSLNLLACCLEVILHFIPSKSSLLFYVLFFFWGFARQLTYSTWIIFYMSKGLTLSNLLLFIKMSHQHQPFIYVRI